tara:strand:+ start:1130055 stop:1133720 length:3666 start_codon:yes stop_codon:yes gene_type:complete
MTVSQETIDLIDRVCLGEATAAEVAKLDALVCGSGEARAAYVRRAEFHNGLRDFAESNSMVDSIKSLAAAGFGPEFATAEDRPIHGEINRDQPSRSPFFIPFAVTSALVSIVLIAASMWVLQRQTPRRVAQQQQQAVLSSPAVTDGQSQGKAAETGLSNPWKTLQTTGSMNHPGLNERSVPVARRDRPIKFNRDIRPILSETCFHCHGPDEHARRADLRLDTIAGATEDLGGYQAIVPGNLDESEAWRRILSDDPDELMPPAESHLVLTPDQKQMFRRWIEEGAVYEGHWAFQPPVARSSTVTDEANDSETAWGRNEIDAFVLARLAEEGMKPSREADARTLIRRLSFDLTGLPPSVNEVRKFIRDYRERGEAAWQDAITRLLDSPHFGERMAVPWMDQSRYADTNGYSIDGGRHMWLWRDWVIQAYNDNMPFDQFAIEQLAGDLLPGATDSQRIATGFNRNHMITHEGGTIPAENLTNYAADRVKTTSEVFLGLTMGCAQCHDHKYDPISQQEYYEFFAFFNELSDKGNDGNGGLNASPSITAQTVIETDELAELERELEQQQHQWLTYTDGFDEWVSAARKEILTRGVGFGLRELKLLDVSSPNRPGPYEIRDDGSVFASVPSRGLNAFSHVLQLSGETPVSGIRIQFFPHAGVADNVAEKAGKDGTGKGGGDASATLTPHPEGVPKITTVLASAGNLPAKQVDYHQQLGLSFATASSSIDGHAPHAVLDERNLDWWQPDDATQPQHLTLTFDEPIDPVKTPYLSVMVFFGRPNSLPSHWRIDGFSGNDTDSIYPAQMVDALSRPLRKGSPDWTKAEEELIRQQFRERAEQLEPLRIRIANLSERIAVLSESFSTMVMDTAKEPRQTFVLSRGQYDAPLDPVESNTPRALPPLPTNDRATRLDFARWLVQSDHPLTSRVAVNRLWALFFGTGIVATSADFGSQGQWPSHPELLDWLAIRFVDSGWDQKELIRTIVSSATYRQDSSVTQDQGTLDPQNRLLGRGPRFRLPAEFIRDQALALSGLLVPRIGGPSVQPYQPMGLWKEVSHFGSTPATKQVFVQDRGEKRYRRSLYTFVKRTSPHPSMAAFDAPNREMCIMQRGVTNTPMQALVTLNDPQFSEAARVFAQHLLVETRDKTETQRMHQAFEKVTGRLPKREEAQVIEEFFGGELERYRQDVDAAQLAIRVGDSPCDPSLDPAMLAAWTSVASLLMNLSETLTRS